MNSNKFCKNSEQTEEFDALKKSELLLAKEEGSETSQLLSLFSWPMQLGILFRAFAYRYSQEESAVMGQTSQIQLIYNWRQTEG